MLFLVCTGCGSVVLQSKPGKHKKVHKGRTLREHSGTTHRANTPKLVPTTVTMGGSVSKRESDQKLDAAEAEKRQKKVSEPQPSVTWTADMAGEASAGAGEEDLVQTVFRWDHGGNQVRRIS